jgi:hypothetical protein
MPIHYGSPEHSFVTISSPLSTQMPQGFYTAPLHRFLALFMPLFRF